MMAPLLGPVTDGGAAVGVGAVLVALLKVASPWIEKLIDARERAVFRRELDQERRLSEAAARIVALEAELARAGARADTAEALARQLLQDRNENDAPPKEGGASSSEGAAGG